MKRSTILWLAVGLTFAAGAIYWRSRPAENQAQRPPAAARAPVAIVAAPAQQSDLPVILRSIGYVEPLATVAVKSRVQSQLLEKHFTEGQTVKKGDLLFTLDDRELAAQVAKDEAALARDEAAVARTNADFERARQLLARNAGTQQALDQATADRRTAQANVQGSQAALDNDKLRLSYTKIYAPIDGRVGAVTVTPGNLVNASEQGAGLVTITSLKPVRVSFILPERELQKVRQAAAEDRQPVVRVYPHGDETRPIEGRLTFIDSSVDQASGTIALKAQFANEDLALWPGLYCDVEIELGVRANAVSVPTVALQSSQKGSFVYVIDGAKASMRAVTAGLTEGGRTEIVQGLRAGDKVVVDGQLRLSDGAPVREAPAMKEADAARGARESAP